MKTETDRIRENEGLAKTFANRWGLGDDDGYQAARIGLLRAARSFDPGKGAKFSTWAAFWIRAELQREQRHRGPLKITARMRQARARVSEARKQLGSNATEQEIAAKAGVHQDAVRNHAAVSDAWPLDIHAPVFGNGYDLAEILPDENAKEPDRYAAQAQQAARLRHALEHLAQSQPIEAHVIRSHLEGLTLREIGDRLGFSREWARQIKDRGLTRIRRQLANIDRGWDQPSELRDAQ